MKFKIPKSYSAIEYVYNKIVVFAKNHGIDHGNINIVLDEICSNIIKYSKIHPRSFIEIEVEKLEKNIALYISYQGIYFNPLKFQKTSDHKTIGNAGIQIVKSFANKIFYKNRKNCNMLIIFLPFDAII